MYCYESAKHACQVRILGLVQVKILIGLNRSLYLTKTNPTPTPAQPNPDMGKTFPQLNHVGSSPNFQDIFHIIYQHDL